jgi:hypothetical protein
MTDRTTEPYDDPQVDEDSNDDESTMEKAKKKLSEIIEAPDAAEYDETKTNPVTGQRRR